MKTWDGSRRLGGLRRFGLAITVLNLAGHTVLGFEQSWVQPLVSLAVAYGMELLLEALDAWGQDRAPRFLGGGLSGFIDFILPAHITGLAVAMLLYANEQLWPVAFGTAVAIGSKSLLRVPVDGKLRHFLNPSNFGISVTLLVFPHIGIAPPYHFTENLTGMGDGLLPLLIICTGTFLNTRFTRRLPLIAGWLGGFILQAALRSWVSDTSLTAALVPMTGVAFVLYTFYMVTDPSTTPQRPGTQLLFGAGVAATYGLLVMLHIVFDLFLALTLVCVVRGGLLLAQSLLAQRASTLDAPALSLEGRPQP